MDLYSIRTIVAASDQNRRSNTVSLRLRDDEAERYWKVMDSAKSKNPYIDKTDVIRELFGLDPPNLVTKEELRYFRTAKDSVEATLNGREIAPNSSSRSITHYEGKGKKKNKVG